MSLSVLVCVLPARGHVSPTLAVVTDLLAAGHSVQVITGAGYRDRFTQAGAEVTVLAPDADFDDGDVDGSFPGRRGLSGIRLARHDLIEAFVRPMPSRWATVGSVLSRFPADVVLVDPLFLAGIPLVMTRPGGRPRVFVLGFLPVTLDPIAPPGALAWLREPVTAFAMHRALAPVQELADHLTRELTGQPLTTWFTQWVGMADGILQMTGPGFEYPRPHPPTPIHFVGPPTHSSSAEYPLPDW